MVGVIVNQNARRIRRDHRLFERLAAITEEAGVALAATSNADEVALAMAGFAAGGVDLVAICGGDGTIGGVLAAMQRCYAAGTMPEIAILPAGTMNTIAQNVGAAGSPERALRALVARQTDGARGRVRALRTLSLNGRPGFIFGAALAARLLEHYYERRAGAARAVGMAVRVPLSALFGTALSRRIFSPVEARVVVDDEQLPSAHYTMLVAATVANVGLGVRITYRAQQDPERFHLIASALPPRALARQFGRTFRGRPLRGPEHHDLLARRAEISFAEPQPCTIDGELVSLSRVELTAGERIRVWHAA